MTKKQKIWTGVIIAIVVIIILYFIFKPSAPVSGTGPATPLVGVNNIDISSLSAQDLATYQSLPDDAAKADFLRVLGLTTVVTPNANTPDGTPSYPNTSTPAPIHMTLWETIKADFYKIFHRNKPAYVQVQPIDDQGCDANGYNAIGVKCL